MNFLSCWTVDRNTLSFTLRYYCITNLIDCYTHWLLQIIDYFHRFIKIPDTDSKWASFDVLIVHFNTQLVLPSVCDLIADFILAGLHLFHRAVCTLSMASDLWYQLTDHSLYWCHHIFTFRANNMQNCGGYLISHSYNQALTCSVAFLGKCLLKVNFSKLLAGWRWVRRW